MYLLEQVKERLSMFKNLYDVIRIVDPVKKKNIIVIDEKKELSRNCYAVWNKEAFCGNCIAMRAYINHDTFIKIEYIKEKIILIIAAPVKLEGNVFIVEILKDITQDDSLSHKLTENSVFIQELVNSINEVSVKDHVTGLYNRRYIEERLPIDINYNRVSKRPLSIIMADIDFFKNEKDGCANVNSDKVLIDFSNLVLRTIRSDTDWVGRYGEEKLIIVLNHTDLNNAQTVAKKIKSQLENTTFKYNDVDINITASFAIYAITDYDIEVSELLSMADKSLYEAKSGGDDITIINEQNINGTRIASIDSKSIKLSRLNEEINQLREVLNEVCCTLDCAETYTDRLLLSQQLDELIVEYMREMNNINQST